MITANESIYIVIVSSNTSILAKKEGEDGTGWTTQPTGDVIFSREQKFRLLTNSHEDDQIQDIKNKISWNPQKNALLQYQYHFQ